MGGVTSIAADNNRHTGLFYDLYPYGEDWKEQTGELLAWSWGISRIIDALEKGEFLGLMLFVGIPLPGTGGWTGSLIAALLDVDFKKALVAEILGILIATVIMSIVSYGLLARIV